MTTTNTTTPAGPSLLERARAARDEQDRAAREAAEREQATLIEEICETADDHLGRVLYGYGIPAGVTWDVHLPTDPTTIPATATTVVDDWTWRYTSTTHSPIEVAFGACDSRDRDGLSDCGQVLWHAVTDLADLVRIVDNEGGGYRGPCTDCIERIAAAKEAAMTLEERQASGIDAPAPAAPAAPIHRPALRPPADLLRAALEHADYARSGSAEHLTDAQLQTIQALTSIAYSLVMLVQGESL